MERSCEPLDKNRIIGVAEQGERARLREAPVIKAKRRISGGCAAKECVLTRGALANRPLSPLLANAMLYEADKVLEQHGHCLALRRRLQCLRMQS